MLKNMYIAQRHIAHVKGNFIGVKIYPGSIQYVHIYHSWPLSFFKCQISSKRKRWSNLKEFLIHSYKS